MHHPIQCRYPEWDDNFDIDGPMAKKTRRAFCECQHRSESTSA
jgi:hypothetical protein